MNIKRLLLRARLHKVHHLEFELTLFAHELIGCQLIQGYIIIEETCCWHVWLEKDGLVIDPIMDIIKEKTGLADASYVREKPEHLTIDENPEFVNKYTMYTKNPKLFWESCDAKFKTFRTQNYMKLKKETNGF